MAEPFDLDALAATCEAATPGPWWVHCSGGVIAASGPEPETDGVDDSQEDAWNEWFATAIFIIDADCEQAAYIATFDPPTVAALIAKAKEAKRLERENRALRSVLQLLVDFNEAQSGAWRRAQEVLAHG